MKKIDTNTNIKKRRKITAKAILQESLDLEGLVSKMVRNLRGKGIDITFHGLLREFEKHPEIRRLAMNERIYDFAEEILVKTMKKTDKNGNPTKDALQASMFYLERHGKSRGYSRLDAEDSKANVNIELTLPTGLKTDDLV